MASGTEDTRNILDPLKEIRPDAPLMYIMAYSYQRAVTEGQPLQNT